MVKEKLTLSVDKEVVEKAKKLGINISDITERILRGYTSAEKPSGSMHDTYQQLFIAIVPLLKQFGGFVNVANSTNKVLNIDTNRYEDWDGGIFLGPDGSFSYDPPFHENFSDITKIDQNAFLSPEKILSNLVDTLARSEEANKRRMQQIIMAKRIVDAMTGTLLGKPEKKSDGGVRHKKNETHI